MLFKIIVKGFSKEINDDLEALLDEITPLYKARFEELATQLQIIVDAIALHWDPINLEQLRTETKLENGQLSPQLKRLVELGWIEKLDAYKAKGSAYQISERFFNIWFLMRRSSRRQKKELYCLSKFLETFYGDDLHEVAKNSLSVKSQNINQIATKLALAEVVKDENLKKQIKEDCHNELKEEAKTNPEVYEKLGLTIDTYIDKDKISIIKKERKYLNILKKNPKDVKTLFLLGYLYQIDLKKYDKAEEIYLKVIELDSNDISAINNLGVIYSDLSNYNQAEKMYLECIKLDKSFSLAWSNLGNLYRTKLEKYEEAEKAYFKIIELESMNAGRWNSLGNLYQDSLKKYDEAEKAYLKAIECDDSFFYSKYNLVFLYRDKMNNLVEAEKLFNTFKINNEVEDSYWLNKSLFELYKRNEGIAFKYIEKALVKIKNTLPDTTQDDWWRFGSVVVKQGYGNWLLSILEEKDFDTILAPYYVAVKALTEKDSEAYLNSKAVEIREPARKIMEIMKKY